MIWAALLGGLIGLVMGTVGGGGAVLTVPILVYVVGLGVHEATTASLAVVAAAALAGVVGQARRHAVCWACAGWFSLAAALGGVLGAFANRAMGGATILVIFSVVMLLAAYATWERSGSEAAAVRGCPDARPRRLGPTGVGVGALTGLVGVGGGFVIVPTLVVGLRFGLREAIGTSMAIVAAVSTFGLATHLATGSALDIPVVLAMGPAAVIGALAGPRCSDLATAEVLGKVLAVLIALLALAIAGSTLLTIARGG